ncbi:MAG: hypothetical protein WC334_05470 [Kiritimatiellales bacterium]|jgi:hypothetical protein
MRKRFALAEVMITVAVAGATVSLSIPVIHRTHGSASVKSPARNIADDNKANPALMFSEQPAQGALGNEKAELDAPVNGQKQQRRGFP